MYDFYIYKSDVDKCIFIIIYATILFNIQHGLTHVYFDKIAFKSANVGEFIWYFG